MNYNTVYVGMDVHKRKFYILCVHNRCRKKFSLQRTEADYKNVLRYLGFYVPSTETMLTSYAVMRLAASVTLYIIS